MMPVVPLMHATGLFNCMGALLVGGRVVTARPGRLDPRHVWETVAAQRVRTLVVAGNAVCQPLVDELLAAEADGRPHDLSSLAAVVSSGTVLGDRLKRALHERAAVTITDALASSEGGPFAFAITSSTADLPSRFFPAAATRVLAADGTEVAPGSGQVGTLAFGGPIPEGYYKDAAKTTATFRTVGGVRYTMPGDLATVDADGAIRFLGRGSGVINTGGEKVHPQEVEDVLLAQPGRDRRVGRRRPRRDLGRAGGGGGRDPEPDDSTVTEQAAARTRSAAAWPATRSPAPSCCCPPSRAPRPASSNWPRSAASPPAQPSPTASSPNPE